MKLNECEAKEVFQREGIPVPQGGVVKTAEEALKTAEEIGSPFALKVQVPIASRGKWGGIKFAETPDEVHKIAGNLLGKTFRGRKIEKLLVERKLDVKQELYLSITVDRSEGEPVIIASNEGGVDIEEVSEERPESIKTSFIDVFMGLQEFQGYDLGLKIGLPENISKEFANIAEKLGVIFQDNDASIAEINPLILTEEEELVAGDAVLNIYNNALFRQNREVKKEGYDNKREYEAAKNGLSYVELDGNIGMYVTGAGLGMTTMDALDYYGEKPANFCESGGATYELAAKALDIILANEDVETLLIVLFGLVSRADVICEALAPAIAEKDPDMEIVSFIGGTGEKQARETMKKVAGIKTEKSLQEAAKKAAEISK